MSKYPGGMQAKINYLEATVHSLAVDKGELCAEIEHLTAEVSAKDFDIQRIRRDFKNVWVENERLNVGYNALLDDRNEARENEAIYRAALEILRMSAQGQDDGWIIDIVDEALQGDKP